jgi:hypothetical protein
MQQNQSFLKRHQNIVTHSRYAKHPPPPAVFHHAVPSRAEVSRARQLLSGNKQLWQRCVTTPVNTTTDNRQSATV